MFLVFINKLSVQNLETTGRKGYAHSRVLLLLHHLGCSKKTDKANQREKAKKRKEKKRKEKKKIFLREKKNFKRKKMQKFQQHF